MELVFGLFVLRGVTRLETFHNRLYNFVCILYNVYKKVDYFMEEREKLKSRLGFILLSAGCAIGIGNVWKFPYTAGQGGGGAFVLFYLLFLIILGLSRVLTL